MKIVLAYDDIKDFEHPYAKFIKEMKEADIADGDQLPLFEKYGYPSLKEVLDKKLNKYLTEIVDEFLFLEFFYPISNPSSHKKIARVLKTDFKIDGIHMDVLYIQD